MVVVNDSNQIYRPHIYLIEIKTICGTKSQPHYYYDKYQEFKTE